MILLARYILKGGGQERGEEGGGGGNSAWGCGHGVEEEEINCEVMEGLGDNVLGAWGTEI